jgi:hypothetical protein
MSEENSDLRPTSENSERRNNDAAVEATLDPVRTGAVGQMLDTLAATSDEAALYRSQGRFAESRSVFTKVREVRRRVLGPEPGPRLSRLKSPVLRLRSHTDCMPSSVPSHLKGRNARMMGSVVL